MSTYGKWLSLFLGIFCLMEAWASQHCSSCPDEDFLELGQRFPSVGYFSQVDGLIFGSGTYVDLAPTKHVVLTCAHLFEEIDPSKLFFNIGTSRISGQLFVPSKYRETRTLYETEVPSYDMAIFLLNTPVPDAIPPARLQLDGSYVSLLEKNYICVGYGMTGHYLGKDLLADGQRRGSYSHAIPKFNCLDSRVGEVYVEQITQEGNLSVWPKRMEIPGESVLYITPFLERFIWKEQLPICIKKPGGVASDGDIGGGVFSEDGRLLGVITEGSCNEDEDSGKQLLIHKPYYQQYKQVIDPLIEEAKIAMEKMPRQFQKKYGGFIYQVLEEEDFSSIFTPPVRPWEIEAKDGVFCETTVTLASFHKDWILETLRPFTS